MTNGYYEFLAGCTYSIHLNSQLERNAFYGELIKFMASSLEGIGKYIISYVQRPGADSFFSIHETGII